MPAKINDMFLESITSEELEKLDFAAFPGKIQVIESVGAEFNRAVAYLRSQKIIGFDTESRPTFSPHQAHHGVALLQLSGKNKAYLFRINKIGMPNKLCALLSDKNILKVGAAVHDDILGLRRIKEYKPEGFVDLQKIVGEWGIRDKSVKKMSAIILGIRISKTQQLSNWEAEHLSEAQCLYAATDAWVCREIYYRLTAEEKNPLVIENQ